MSEKIYSLEELRAMPKADAEMLIAKASKIEGTAVVRDKDGKVKYDDPELAGSYHEESA